jgi:hypothetical protein
MGIMDLDEIKRGLRAEIKKRENEQYFTFQCNVRQMCKDVLAKLEEQESEIAELKAQKAQAEDDVAFWKKKLSSCLNGDCILTCDTVEKYGKENVRLKRALWLARAERAHLKVLEYWPDYCHNAHCRIAEQKWDKVERKCRAMAEKFGG